MKRVIIVVILVVIAIVGFVSYSKSYVQFKPIVFQAEANHYKEIKPDDQFYKRLEVVLKAYHVHYKLKEGHIYVQRSLAFDDEMLYNYTAKALNKQWKNPIRTSKEK